MKKTFIFLVIFLPLLLNAQTNWVRWWPQPQAASVWPNNIIKTYDGGYAFHWTYYFHDQFDEYYEDRLFKTDSLGNLLWEQQWSANLSIPELNTLNQMPDSSYLWAGRYIVKVTPDGQFAWTIDVDTLIDYGAEIYTSTLTPDGNVVFVAYKHNGLGDDYWWLLKMDSNGNVLWLQPYLFESRPFQIRNLLGDRLIVSGDNGNNEILLLKFSYNGILYWSQVVNTNISGPSGLLVDRQKNLLLYGYASTPNKNHLVYADTLGSIIWNKHLSLPDTNLSIGVILNSVEKIENCFIMTAARISSIDVKAIMKIDSLGNIEWWQSLPGNLLGFELPKNNLIEVDDGYVIGLYKRINFIDNIGIAKTDLNGNIVGITSKLHIVPESIILYQNYPNPFNASTTISFHLTKPALTEVSILNLTGKKIATLICEKFNAGYHQITWNAEQFASGIYFYRLKVNKDQSIMKKMFLIK